MSQGIIEALRHDHDEIREMLAQLDTATGEQRRDLFQRLLSELVRHEVAEEEILRPVSKRDAGEEIANARVREESRAEELLKEMEKLDPAGAEFTTKLATLHQEVESHASAEETQEFPQVQAKESPERLEKMARVYEAAKMAAPTRPHPSTPNTPIANMMIGPFAAVVDRARDAVRDAMKTTS